MAVAAHPRIPKRLSIIGIVTVLLVLGLAEWLVWQKQDNDTASVTTSSVNADTPRQAVAQPAGNIAQLSPNAALLPAGWSLDAAISDDQRVMLRQSSTGCWVDSVVATQAPVVFVEAKQQNLAAIQAKGYTVVEQPDTSLTVPTSGGQRELPAQSLTVSGIGDTLYQYYVVLAASDGSVRLQASCPQAIDRQQVQAVLQAVTTKL